MEDKRYDWHEKEQENGLQMANEQKEREYMSLARKMDSSGRKIRSTFGDNINVISLVVLVILQFFIPYMGVGVRNPFSASYIFQMSFNVAATLFSYYLFIPNGKSDRMKTEEYTLAEKAWREASVRLRANKLLSKFREYCVRYAKEEAKEEDRVNLEILANTGIPETVFAEKYNVMSRKALRRAKRRGEINEEQKRAIMLCRKPTKIRIISPNFILSGATMHRTTEALREDSHYEKRSMITKPIVTIGFAVITSFFYPEKRISADVLATLANIFIRVFSVCISSVMGYRTGVKGIDGRIADMRVRECFINEFTEGAE